MASLRDSIPSDERVIRDDCITPWYYVSNGLALVLVTPLAMAVLWLMSYVLTVLLRALGALGAAPVLPIVGWLAFLPWLGLLLMLGGAVYLFLEASAVRYVLTDTRLLVFRGLFAHSTMAVPVSRIQDVRVRQPFVGRLLDYGLLLVETAGTFGQTVLRYVPDPDGWALDIDGAMHHRISEPSSTPVPSPVPSATQEVPMTLGRDLLSP
jgi:membrane protein YdbS with pleckstrin-like domain